MLCGWKHCITFTQVVLYVTQSIYKDQRKLNLLHTAFLLIFYLKTFVQTACCAVPSMPLHSQKNEQDKSIDQKGGTLLSREQLMFICIVCTFNCEVKAMSPNWWLNFALPFPRGNDNKTKFSRRRESLILNSFTSKGITSKVLCMLAFQGNL